MAKGAKDAENELGNWVELLIKGCGIIARNSPIDVSEYSQSFDKQIQAEILVMLNAKGNSEVIVPYNDDSTHPG